MAWAKGLDDLMLEQQELTASIPIYRATFVPIEMRLGTEVTWASKLRKYNSGQYRTMDELSTLLEPASLKASLQLTN